MHASFTQHFLVPRLLAVLLCVCLVGLPSASARLVEDFIPLTQEAQEKISAGTERRLARLERRKRQHAVLSASSRRRTVVEISLAPLLPQQLRVTGTKTISPSTEQDQLLFLINEERAKAGVGPLIMNRLLTESAENYAEDMENNHFFSHTDLRGLHSIDRIRETGYLDIDCKCSWQYWTGENLAQGQTSISEVLQDWMESPSHRENILHPQFMEIGIGRSGNTWVQHFGRVKLYIARQASSKILFA